MVVRTDTQVVVMVKATWVAEMVLADMGVGAKEEVVKVKEVTMAAIRVVGVTALGESAVATAEGEKGLEVVSQAASGTCY